MSAAFTRPTIAGAERCICTTLEEPRLHPARTCGGIADDEQSIRRLFADEPGVFWIGTANPRGKRGYQTLRIPEAVAMRGVEKTWRWGMTAEPIPPNASRTWPPFAGISALSSPPRATAPSPPIPAWCVLRWQSWRGRRGNWRGCEYERSASKPGR